MASILIIDDEVAIATAFAMFFRHDGKHQVTEAHTGGEGIEAFRRAYPKARIMPGAVLCPTPSVIRLSEVDVALPWDLAPLPAS